jgi:porin
MVKGFLLVSMVLATVCMADTANSQNDIFERESLTNGFFGLNDALSSGGIEFSLGTTQIYQQNARGGISTHRKSGRFTGSFDLEINADMQKLLGIEGGRVYMLAESSFSNGIDEPSVGSYFGVNGDAYSGYRGIDVTELWYEQSMFDDDFRIRVGKLDLTGGFDHHGCPVSFDASMFANDERSQFLNNALINNPTIPFPDRGLGLALYWHVAGSWYLSGAAADAQADARETGFNTTFGGEDYFFYIFETGITPKLDSANGELQGAYRIGTWYDPQPKANSDSEKYYRDDTGFYLSFDQMLMKENSDANDTQGLGTFARYGYADSDKNDMTNFYSFGIQYQGLFDGRDEDVLGVGYARGFFSDKASVTYTEDYESVVETYYNMVITKWARLTPSIQYVANTGGDKNNKDAVIFGTRLQVTF